MWHIGPLKLIAIVTGGLRVATPDKFAGIVLSMNLRSVGIQPLRPNTQYVSITNLIYGIQKHTKWNQNLYELQCHVIIT